MKRKSESIIIKQERAFCEGVGTTKEKCVTTVLEAFGEPISYGGQEAFVMNAIEHLNRDDFNIDLFTPYYCDNDTIIDRMKEFNGTVFALGCRFNPGGLRIDSNKQIRRFLASRKYDIIHIHSGSNTMLALLAKEAHNAGIAKIIVHAHCAGRPSWKHTISKLLTSSVLKRFPDEYCACSEEAGLWRYPKSICRKRLKVIHNGIDIERFRYNSEIRSLIRRSNNINDDIMLIGCVGRLSFQKNQSFLIRLLKEIRDNQEYDAGYKLILIGDGEDREKLELLVSNLGLLNCVLFTGAVSDTAGYYSAMDVFVLPSIYEGFPVSMIEAQAAGLEIIASDYITHSSDITNTVTFISLDDISEWKRKIASAHNRYQDKDLSEKMSDYSAKNTALELGAMYGKKNIKKDEY